MKRFNTDVFSRLRAAAFLGSLALSSLPAQALDTSLVLNPRYDYIRSQESEQAHRLFLKTQGLVRSEDFSATFEAFAEKDFASGDPDFPDLRRSDTTVELQEAYVESRFGNVFVRLGRQPVRWSQSWTLPSLDVWTARRWNRLFFDPLPEQLIHPDGALFTYAGDGAEIDFFMAIAPARDRFPKPLPEGEKREIEPEFGARLQKRMSGLDLTGVYKFEPADHDALVSTRLSDRHIYGGALSYAFDCCVAKTEAGLDDRQNGFLTFGLDVLLEPWSILPQITRYLDEVTSRDEYETLFYMPMRWARDENAIEFQIYRNFEAHETFGALQISRDLNEAVRLSLFAQKYEGRQGRLFGLYQNLTEGEIYGVRLDLTSSL